MRELNPQLERQQRIARVVELFEKGLDDTEDCIGYHGTSLEALQYLIENGHWPVSNLEGFYGDTPGISFYPRKSQFSTFDLLGVNFPDEKYMAKEAANYAEQIARSHHLLRLLNLPIDDDAMEDNARNIANNSPDDARDPEKEYRFFLEIVKDKKILDEAIAKAKKRHGVVIGLSKSALGKGTVQHGDPGDLRILTPSGVDLSFISGIEPMGQEEFDFLKNLQRSLQ